MLFGFGEKKILALDIGTSSIKLAEIEHTRVGPMLKTFGVYPLNVGMVNGGEIVDTAAVSDCLAALVKTAGSRRKHVCTAMWGSSVIVKKISMEKMPDNLLTEQLKYEAEQYIPFNINEISLEHHVLRNQTGSSEGMEVLLVAAKQEFLFRFMEAIEQSPNLKLQCSMIDVSGFALANCFEVNYGVLDATVALLNIGGGVTNFVVIDRGEVIFCRDIPVGGLTYTMEINKQMGVSIPEAESHKISATHQQATPEEVPGIIAATNDLVVEELMQNSFEFYGATSSGPTIQKFFVSGGSIAIPGLVDRISKSASIPHEIFDPFRKIACDPKKFSSDRINEIRSISPVALGLAMRKLNEK